MDTGNLEGIIPLIGGSYALLAVHGKIKVKNKEFVEKHRKLMLVCGYGCIVFGLLLLSGFFGMMSANDCPDCAAVFLKNQP